MVIPYILLSMSIAVLFLLSHSCVLKGRVKTFG
uniref:Uncharacterized protein n=1 Tax=Arundo donax TaxID=35708 RepID=A0A0A9GVF5_ARUDO